ncbi:hypothetical protein BC937DRAFT_94682 [Endogone sp. FLAS-F59071]|nr:hypothetical protein BC937DRAFT_94682 [Endogone sp. FLAS-F59071]|eukprot:RUS13852.1 hypothetical protein BC937DRAFT_94682 [Endogone sp. FLAS-F59071]
MLAQLSEAAPLNSASTMMESERTRGPNNDGYDKIVNQIKSIRKDDGAARTNPMWWGVIDMRLLVSPGEDLSRAKEFLSQGELGLLYNRVTDIIAVESCLNESCVSFLEAISISDVASIHELARKYRSRGLIGIANFLRETNPVEDMEVLQHLDEEDQDTGYIGDCFSATYI